jgi:hypothetical protein
MKILWKKEYCSHCGKAYDPARGKCPSCGTPSINERDARAFASMTPLGPTKEITLFLVGLLGFELLGTLWAYLVQSLVRSAYYAAGMSNAAVAAALTSFVGTSTYAGIINYTLYIVLFCIMVSIVGKDLNRLTEKFKEPRSYFGILFGFLAIGVSIGWNLISQKLGATSSNENQSIVNGMIGSAPVLAILCIGLIAPFNEELAYRVGLFGCSKRINIYVAYFMASIVFGFIHMHFTSVGWDNINEWLSLPDYVLAGLIFAFVYDHYGFAGSFMAHATNNLIAVISTLINIAISNR